MILNKIYTFPKKLFDEVEFHNGLNIIYAHKPPESSTEKLIEEESTKVERSSLPRPVGEIPIQSADDSKHSHYSEDKTSLHAVGKSTLLDLILFALLFDEKSFHRLQNAYHKKILKGLSVVLEFTVNEVKYYVRRSFDNANNKIFFGPINHGESYSLGKLREILYKLIFERSDYSGIAKHFWHQKLLSYFIKVKKREELFSDPVEFSRNFSELEITPFHLFLLNINNTLPYEHKEVLESIQKLESFLKEQQNYLIKNSKTKDLTKLENKRQHLKNIINKLEKRINEFSLTENYAEFEQQADELTTEIKKLWFKNVVDKKKLQDLEEYENAMPAEAYEDIPYITNIYNEVNYLLAGNIKRTLKEAVDFRKALFSSRKDFVSEERGRLNSSIYKREEIISDMETKRKIFLDELSRQGALDDLTETYSRLAQIQQQLSDIESSLKTIDKTKEDITIKKDEHELLLEKVRDYIESISTEVQQFRELLLSVYTQLFLDKHNVKIFDVAETDEKQKIKISVLEGSIIDSTGINQVRTLIYDIAVLLNIIHKNLNAPRFIIHDGIFENLHKSHFLAFITFIEDLLAKDYKFQYILTLNEHDFLEELPSFKEEKIIKNSVIKLTPKKTLFGSEF